ncbi:hypothetical protein ILUMI_18602, partial [Ignelater luminosus]
NKEGLLLGNTTEKLGRWAQHFEELLNSQEEQTEQRRPQKIQDHERNNEQDQVKERTDQEIQEIIKGLKNKKSAGDYGIPAKILKEE